MPTVRVEIANIKCNRTDNVVGADDIYFLHDVDCGPPPATFGVLDPIPAKALIRGESPSVEIDDNQVKVFRDANGNFAGLLFNGPCPRTDWTPAELEAAGGTPPKASVNGPVYLFNRRRGKAKVFVGKLLDKTFPFLIAGTVLATLAAFYAGLLVSLFGFAPGLLGGFLAGAIAGTAGFTLMVATALGGVLIAAVVDRIRDDHFIGGFVLNVEPTGDRTEVRNVRLTGGSDIRTTGYVDAQGTRVDSVTFTGVQNLDYEVRVFIARSP